MVGHQSPFDLAGVALGTMTVNVTGQSLIIGLLAGMDTLASQAFGKKEYHRLGETLQQSLLLLLFVSLPIGCLWFFGVEKILLYLHMKADIARLASSYARWMIPTLITNSIFESLKRFLQTQNIVTPMLYVTLIAAASHIGTGWLFIYVFGMGVRGAAIANGITSSQMMIMLLLYTVYFRPYNIKTWAGFSLKAISFSQMLHYLRFAIPGAIWMMTEWWVFEALAILAGWIGDGVTPLATHAIFANLVSLLFMLPLGLGVAASVRVGQYLGSDRPQRSKASAFLATVLTEGFAVIFASLLYIFRTSIATFFTKDMKVILMFKQTAPFVAAFILVDFYQGVFQGIAKGSGKQKYGVIIFAFTNYGISFPLAYYLVVCGQLAIPLEALWIGMCAGYGLACISFTFVFLCLIQWQKVAIPKNIAKSMIVPETTQCTTLDVADKDYDVATEKSRLLQNNSTQNGSVALYTASF